MLPRATSSVLHAGASSAIDRTRRTLLLPIAEAAASTAFTGSRAFCGSKSLANATSSPDESDGPEKVVPAENWTTWHRDGAVRLRMTESGPGADKPVSVMKFFKDAVERVPNRPAIASKINGSWVMQTYEQYYENTRRVARSFIQLGLDRYSSVGILGFNSAEWFLSCLGAVFAGGLSAGIYTTSTPAACKFIAEQARCNIIVVDDDKQLQKILSIRDQLPHLRAIIQYKGQPDKRVPGVYSWEEFMKLGSQSLENELQMRIKDQATNKGCTLIYTSGTTGNPKGVILSHDNMTWTSRRVVNRVGYTIDSCMKTVTYLPLSHIAAQIADLYGPIGIGATIYFAQPDALRGTLVETCKEVQPTHLLGVPRVFEKVHQAVEEATAKGGFVKKTMVSLARKAGTRATVARMSGKEPSAVSKLADRIVLSKIREALGLGNAAFCLSAAAPISRPTLDFLASIHAMPIEVLGMSETSGPHTFGDPYDNEIGSVGRELDGSDTFIDEPNENGVGEMLFNGRNVCMGYLDNEEKTNEVFGGPCGKYLKSGDLGRRDSRGFIYVTGRIKEILVTAGGENIPSVEIEDMVKTRLPSILSNVMLIGDGRRYLSMLITLSSEMDQETLLPLDKLTPNAIFWCRAHGISATTASEAVRDATLNRAIQQAIEDVNRSVKSRAQRIQKWTLLPKDFSIAGGELGPTLKLRRHQVLLNYAGIIESMYSEQPITEQQQSGMASLSPVNLHNS